MEATEADEMLPVKDGKEGFGSKLRACWICSHSLSGVRCAVAELFLLLRGFAGIALAGVLC